MISSNDVLEYQIELLENLKLLDRIKKSGNCSTCSNAGKCEYEPTDQQLLRYNCPFYNKHIKKNGCKWRVQSSLNFCTHKNNAGCLCETSCRLFETEDDE